MWQEVEALKKVGQCGSLRNLEQPWGTPEKADAWVTELSIFLYLILFFNKLFKNGSIMYRLTTLKLCKRL